ncbi:MAG TPA: Hsp20/alpha crystallin family protein [Saprospiraceae bacterium]|nr:Hsp20/alpha crystallin family protein [Saprospiraceae bacterium]
MKIIKPNYHPVKDVFQDFFSSAINRSMTDVLNGDFAITQPSVNIKEGSDDYKIEIAAPGLQKADFNIAIDNTKLTVSTKKEQSSEETKDKFTRKEFSYSSFSRSFDLPDSIQAEGIKASYDNGILEIMLPKKAEAKQQLNRTIEIN